jgi:hypothetical protein
MKLIAGNRFIACAKRYRITEPAPCRGKARVKVCPQPYRRLWALTPVLRLTDTSYGRRCSRVFVALNTGLLYAGYKSNCHSKSIESNSAFIIYICRFDEEIV